jgi:2-C-methyl-D-erythritol 4-phosphate cytidylyltransferase
MADLSVIIPAAGSGSRFGGEIPKPFIRIGGKTILEYTLERFNKPELVAEIIVPVATDWLDSVHKLICSENFQVPIKFVQGGQERMYSISNALELMNLYSKFVAIHDAVRPFFSDMLLQRLMESVRESGAVIPGIPVSDTIKVVDSKQIVTHTPDRSTLFAVQTPQCFRIDWIKHAYQLAIQSNRFGTDDAAICELAGYPVKVVAGDRDNFKITWPEDLEKAQKQLNKQENR